MRIFKRMKSDFPFQFVCLDASKLEVLQLNLVLASSIHFVQTKVHIFEFFNSRAEKNERKQGRDGEGKE